jgi:subtilase family serine protease
MGFRTLEKTVKIVSPKLRLSLISTIALALGFGSFQDVSAQMAPFTQAAPNLSADDLARASPALSDTQLTIEITFNIRNRKLLQGLANHDPNSPLNGEQLTREQFHNLFGARKSDYQAVEQWLQDNGFSIRDESYGSGGSDFIIFTGAVDQVEKAFDTQIVVLNSTPGTYSNTSAPLVPSALAPAIESITGLNSSMPP